MLTNDQDNDNAVVHLVSYKRGPSGQSTAPNITRAISSEAWNSYVDYPSRESKHDIKVSEGDIKEKSRDRIMQESAHL